MFYIRSHNEYVAGPRNILAAERGEDDLALDDMHADWSSGAVSFHVAARRDGDDRNPQYSLLDQGARTTSVASEERPVDHPLILFQMVD
ncbi:MAG TPA: hypothetical protein VFD64_07610 [Gemmatimonadaceae bacterium]|nr:hypothetical protein [Gemmatimonadaceae bacterium]